MKPNGLGEIVWLCQLCYKYYKPKHVGLNTGMLWSLKNTFEGLETYLLISLFQYDDDNLSKLDQKLANKVWLQDILTLCGEYPSHPYKEYHNVVSLPFTT